MLKNSLVRYVDDNKVSHVEAKVVENLSNKLKKHFAELVMTRRNNHTFWGMNINIMEDKKFEIEMKDKILEAIEAFGENIDEKLTTPASSHLFMVKKQAQKLDEEKSKRFHSLVEKLL